VRHVEHDGIAEGAQHRERPRIDDEIVVTKRHAALGHDHLRVAAVGDFRDRVLHVLGREELALLDIDGAPGLRRGDDQIGLSRQNAGICRMSATSAAGAAWFAS
jgi:hypothetical protein